MPVMAGPVMAPLHAVYETFVWVSVLLSLCARLARVTLWLAMRSIEETLRLCSILGILLIELRTCGL